MDGSRAGDVPWVYVSYADVDEEHTRQAAQFGDFLMACGIPVHLAAWEEHRRTDRPTWSVRRILASDYVVVIVSRAYRRAANGECAAHEHQRAQFEAALLADRVFGDRAAWSPRILPVVLAGHKASDIPEFLQPNSATHFRLPELNVVAADSLLRALTSQPRYVATSVAPRTASAPAPRELEPPAAGGIRVTQSSAGLGDLTISAQSSTHTLPLDEAAILLLRRMVLHPGTSMDVRAAAALTGHDIAATQQQLQVLTRMDLITEESPERFAVRESMRRHCENESRRLDGHEGRRRALRALVAHYVNTALAADMLISPQRNRADVGFHPCAPGSPSTYQEALGWFEAERQSLLALCTSMDPALDGWRWRLSHVMRSYLFLRERRDTWIEIEGVALADAQSTADVHVQARMHAQMGLAWRERSEASAAMRHFQSAHRLFKTAGDEYGVANALASAGETLLYQGRR